MPERQKNLYRVFNALVLPADRVLIAGSAPLYSLGILEGSPRDLDVVVHPSYWETIKKRFGLPQDVKSGPFSGQRIEFDYNRDGIEDIDFTDSWPMAGVTTTELFEDAQNIDGALHLSVEHVIKTKQVLNRRKDHFHLAAIAAYVRFIERNDQPVPWPTHKTPIIKKLLDI